MFRCNPYGGCRSHGPVCAAIGKRALTDWSETATADSASIRHGAVCVCACLELFHLPKHFMSVIAAQFTRPANA